MNTFDPILLATSTQFQLLSAKPLSGGLSNRCWALELQRRQTGETVKAVWRPAADSTKAFGLSRRQEHHILKQLHRSPIAPNSLALLEQGLLVEWVVGSTADETLPDQDLLQLQAEIHTFPVPSWRLEPQAKAVHYWQHIPREYKSLQLEQIHRYFQQQTLFHWFDDTCCHHDLGRYNIICQPDGNKRVIDWEYAAAGDPSLDLTLTITANGLDISSAVSTYCELQGYSDHKRWCEAVQFWLPWSDYLAMLWYFVGASLWQDTSYIKEAKALQLKLASIVE
ncbi:phosphotransferase [uncultured Photobacterium sp.]|uniref:phosphotransferase n=1 Tax=uncultured Photobacterium sp. TaxID=173973 RepID=UPI002603D8F3|nr:phosphotransferase [uncultured Photobacterium sp.]